MIDYLLALGRLNPTLSRCRTMHLTTLRSPKGFGVLRVTLCNHCARIRELKEGSTHDHPQFLNQ